MVKGKRKRWSGKQCWGSFGGQEKSKSYSIAENHDSLEIHPFKLSHLTLFLRFLSLSSLIRSVHSINKTLNERVATSEWSIYLIVLHKKKRMYRYFLTETLGEKSGDKHSTTETTIANDDGDDGWGGRDD